MYLQGCAQCDLPVWTGEVDKLYVLSSTGHKILESFMTRMAEKWHRASKYQEIPGVTEMYAVAGMKRVSLSAECQGRFGVQASTFPSFP